MFHKHILFIWLYMFNPHISLGMQPQIVVPYHTYQFHICASPTLILFADLIYFFKCKLWCKLAKVDITCILAFEMAAESVCRFSPPPSLLHFLIIPHATKGIMFLTRPSISQSVCQSCFSCSRNSYETAQQNFVKLCSYEGYNV